MVSCLIGFAILFHGNAQVTAGNDPSIYGKAGVTKFPHGVAIHTLQLFPLACWLMTKLGLPIEQRTRLIVYLIASTTTLLLFSIIQTLSGQSRFDLTFGGGLCLAALNHLCLATSALFEPHHDARVKACCRTDGVLPSHHSQDANFALVDWITAQVSRG